MNERPAYQAWARREFVSSGLYKSFNSRKLLAFAAIVFLLATGIPDATASSAATPVVAPPWDGPTAEPMLHVEWPFSVQVTEIARPEEPIMVPEPGVLALFAGGACISLMFRTRRKPA